MALPLKSLRNAKPTLIPPNDDRPNSGLREGSVIHAEVNAAIARAEKTVIFGQQNRLRNGILMGDVKLPRFHAGHELVRFFYQGMNKLPEYFLDALLESNVSVTLVTGSSEVDSGDPEVDRLARATGGDLIVFKDVRNHQSFHTGYTRKTIYLPEGIVREAIYKGWDSWAIAEAIVREACPLLNYLLILEFIRYAQQRLRSKFTIGSQNVIKSTFRRLNKHLIESPSEDSEDEESEFDTFFRHYCKKFFRFDRKILNQDPYTLADSIFDEPRERIWADIKRNQIATTFDFPDFFDLDRDIVHPAAYRAADVVGQEIAPKTPDDLVHDLGDAARFRVLRQTKTDDLLDQIILKGGPAILRLIDRFGEELASGQLEICESHHDNYDVINEFKEKLIENSTTGIEGIPGSIANDVRDLIRMRTKAHSRQYLADFRELPIEQKHANIKYFRKVVDRIIGFANFSTAEDQAMLAANVARARHPDQLIGMMETVLGDPDPPAEQNLMLNILKKLDRHPDYHGLIASQVGELMGGGSFSLGENVRDQVDSLATLLPARPYGLSSDPQGVIRRHNAYRNLRRQNPDDEALFSHLIGVLVRLDRAENYEQICERITPIAHRAKEELEDLVDKLNPNDPGKKRIIAAAKEMLTVAAFVEV